MNYQILEYINSTGDIPYQKWFNSLDAIVAVKLTTALIRMQLGNLSNIKWFRGIGEYKIDFGPGYRIYLGKDDKKLILLLGGTKKSQPKDIEVALSFWAEYKQQKKQNKR